VTTTKPLPPHGSERRYKGTRNGSRPPCRCDKCKRANRLAAIARERNRLNGIPNMISRDILLPHIRMLTASGMSQELIARRAQVAQTTISYLVIGRNQSCQRDKALRILAVQPGVFDDIAERPALTSTRQLQALYAIGHSRITIAANTGLHEATISDIANGKYTKVDGSTATAITLAYRRLGEVHGTSWKSRLRAREEGWAPPAAWDDDTIDDPEAAPEWTGYCGTDRGYWTHRLQNIPGCPRCEAAHQQWLSEHAHLDGKTRNKLVFAQRAAASTREAALAEDARELMRLGADHENAAARLGVTRQHLQQALLRHPDMEVAA
jgi:plasmid maintenance system antidote protein VapI